MVLSEPKYNIVNIVGRNIVSVHDMVKAPADVMGKEPVVEYTEDRYGQILKEDILNDRLKSLGWTEKTNYKEGIEKSWEFYKENGFKF